MFFVLFFYLRSFLVCWFLVPFCSFLRLNQEVSLTSELYCAVDSLYVESPYVSVSPVFV